MAIKGKGRTKARQPVRAPRREPVTVPVPFARRRGVQLIAAFVAGLLVFLGGVWLTNGLRAERAAEEERVEELQRRQAGAAWSDLVTSEVNTIGTAQEGRPPQILPQLRARLRELREDGSGKVAEELETAAADAQEAADAIAGFDLTGTLRDKGFDQPAVLRFLAARDDLVAAIRLAREAALLGVTASGLEGAGKADVLQRAGSVLALSDTAATRFYENHTEAMAAAGIVQQPTFPGS